MTQSVLIVDADQGFTDSTQVALEERGVVVHVRDDAPLDLIRKLRPTVMMLNVELPKGATTGLSICSRIRRDRELRATPILLTTTGASSDMLKKHASSTDKADDYARKPIALDDVIARLGKLLQAAPPQDEIETTPPDEDEDEPEVEERAEKTETAALSPPPRPSTTLPPPTLPPPSLSTAARAGTTTNAPPPLKRESTVAATATADELWRPMRVEEALRGMLEVQEPAAPTKATPEERLAYMRQLVKYYEARDKAFRDAWTISQAAGTDLAKRTVTLAIELDRREKRIEEIAGERDTAQRRMLSVETEFKAFQDEITRIFRDKDAEEQATYARLTDLEQTSAKLAKDLETANEQNKDHEKRLQIFQDEIEALQIEKDDAEAKVIELASTLDDVNSTAADLRARLETTDTVASERADEIEKLSEKLDRIALDAGQERQRLVAAHESASAEAKAAHSTALETLEAGQRAEIASLIKRHEELLETLTGTHESEVDSLDAQRAEEKKRGDELAKQLATLEQISRDATAAHEIEAAQLRGEVDDLEKTRERLSSDLDTTTTLYTAVVDERDSLTHELESTQGTLDAAKKRIEEQDAALDALAAETAAEKTKLNERIAELEEEVDAAQNDSFERLAELERLKKAHEKTTTKAQNLETSLKISEKALGVAETRNRAIESENAVMKARDDELSRQNGDLEAQQKRLETAQQENAAMLERERERFSRVEDLLIKAKDRIGELQTESEAQARRVVELEEEAARREAELSEAYSAVTDAERRLSEATRSHGEEVAKLKPDAETARAKVDALERDLRALEATEQALLKEIDAREEKITTLDGEVTKLSARASLAAEELESEKKRAHGFSQLSTQQGEMLRRLVAALSAGLDVLNRPRSSDELLREALAERVSSSLPSETVHSPLPTSVMTSPFAAPPTLPSPPVHTEQAAPAQVAVPVPAPAPKKADPFGGKTGEQPAIKKDFGTKTGEQPALAKPQPPSSSPPQSSSPPPAQKQPRAARKAPPPLPAKPAAANASPANANPQKPFAALVGEASRTHGFEESFAEESTTTDGPSLRRFDSVDGSPGPRNNPTSPWDLPKTRQSPAKKQAAYSEEEELKKLTELLSDGDEPEEDRHVTEVIRIDELK